MYFEVLYILATEKHETESVEKKIKGQQLPSGTLTTVVFGIPWYPFDVG